MHHGGRSEGCELWQLRLCGRLCSRLCSGLHPRLLLLLLLLLLHDVRACACACACAACCACGRVVGDAAASTSTTSTADETRETRQRALCRAQSRHGEESTYQQRANCGGDSTPHGGKQAASHAAALPVSTLVTVSQCVRLFPRPIACWSPSLLLLSWSRLSGRSILCCLCSLCATSTRAQRRARRARGEQRGTPRRQQRRPAGTTPIEQRVEGQQTWGGTGGTAALGVVVQHGLRLSNGSRSCVSIHCFIPSASPAQSSQAPAARRNW